MRVFWGFSLDFSQFSIIHTLLCFVWLVVCIYFKIKYTYFKIVYMHIHTFVSISVYISMYFEGMYMDVWS